MNVPNIGRFVAAAVVTAWALLIAPVPSVSAVSSASAGSCPDIEVLFARGTGEPPGVGGIGRAFVDSLRSKVEPKSMAVYAVDYPATTDFPTAMSGIDDASSHIEHTAANCSDTKMVLGGFSQGAAIMGFVTSASVPDGAPGDAPHPMPLDVANHVVAVALFGLPSAQFMDSIGQPPIVIGPVYAAKTTQLCAAGDPVCDGGGDWTAHNSYANDGMVDQAASFVASQLNPTTP